MDRHSNVAVFCMLACVFFASSVFAGVTFNFKPITSNDPSGIAGLAGSDGIVMDVSDGGYNSQLGLNQVLFTFSVGPTTTIYDSFFIRGVYFYDGVLLDIAELQETSPEVDFKVGATPHNLPGFDPDAHAIVGGFEASSLELQGGASAEPSIAVNSVGQGESLGVVFTITQGNGYAEVIDGINSGQIVVGVKAQGFDDYSEGFVTTIVPVPGAFLLAGIGIGLVGAMRRRRVI